MIRLAALLPATMTGPELPPSRAAFAVSRRRPERCFTAPWQVVQFFVRIGLTSRVKSIGSAAQAPGMDNKAANEASSSLMFRPGESTGQVGHILWAGATGGHGVALRG